MNFNFCYYKIKRKKYFIKKKTLDGQEIKNKALSMMKKFYTNNSSLGDSTAMSDIALIER